MIHRGWGRGVTPLLLAHGSPDPLANTELGELRGLVAQRLGIPIRLAVLEFPARELPVLAGALRALNGAERVVAQPLVLFEGRHQSRDLPALMGQTERDLGVEVTLGEILGNDPALADLTAARLEEVGPGEGDLLLFVGRGSSELAALRQTEAVAARVAERLRLPRLVCYAGISSPDLAQGFRAAAVLMPRRILVVPYLLHTGRLARRVTDVLVPLARRRGVPLLVLPHLGNCDAVVGLVARRLAALLKMVENAEAPAG